MHDAHVLCSAAHMSCARSSACVSCACGPYRLVRISPTCACIVHVSCIDMFNVYAPTVAFGSPECLLGVLVQSPLTLSSPTKRCSDGWWFGLVFIINKAVCPPLFFVR